MIIIIDLDGTVVDSSARALSCANERERYWAYGEIQKDKLIRGAKEFLAAAQAQHHTIVFVSERVESSRTATEKWLADNLEVATDDATLRLRPDRDNMLPPEVWKKNVAAEVCASLGESPTNPRVMAIDNEYPALEQYEDFGALTLKAPECWGVLYPDAPVATPNMDPSTPDL